MNIQNVLRGLFGIGTLFLPVILIYTGWMISKEKRVQASGSNFWAILLVLCLSSFVQAFFGDPLAGTEPQAEFMTRIGNAVKLLWENGKELRGGGLLSGLIVGPLVAAFDVIGARIIISVFVIVVLMVMTNRSIPEMLRLVAKPFVWIWHGIVRAATNGMDLIDGFELAEDEPEEEPEREPRPDKPQKYVRSSKRDIPQPEPEKPEPSARRRRRQEEKEIAFMLDHNAAPPPEIDRTDLRNIDMDVPIFDHSEPVPEEELNTLTPELQEENEGFRMSREEEASLEALAEQASLESDEQANRLPWLEDGEPDESVYEEEPEIPYIAPRLELLHRADNSANDADKSMELREKGKLLVDTLASFGVSVRIIGIRRGPTVTRYEIQPAAGVKISKITQLADDIGLNLGGKSVRIEAPIPGKPAVGIEVPNNTKDTVSLREILESEEFQNSQSKLTFAVGKDIDGHVILGDIAKMPHMIIAGTTGSGKSVCTNSIIMSILFHASPDEVRLILVDPKVVEFQPYDGIPHLLIPVVTQPQKAAGALNWAVLEMERRYMLCATYGVRDLKGYNAVAEKNPELKKLPQIVIIIDEFADLMMSSGKEVEAAVIRIAQKARAAGIHLIIATQRPTVDVITGLIKSNVPSRIGMSVKSAVDSRTILDTTGAETLLGNGDLLFYPNGWREPKRVQGCFVTDQEVEAVATFLKSSGESVYDAEIIEAVEQATPANKSEKTSDDDIGELTGDEALVLKAAELAVDAGQLSTTALQRRLKLGYAKAARIVDELEERGIIGPSEGAKPRKVIMTPQQLTEWKLQLASNGSKVE
ncbi:MAG: DNA translocase FtsK [Oscillospiraceae bacterium]|nr:DNA translocase FtsK [Oscillospiraceae bacterium]